MKELKIDTNTLSLKEKDRVVYSVYFISEYGDVNIKVENQLDGNYNGMSSSDFERIQKKLKKDKVKVSEENWIKFLEANKSLLKHISNIPEKFELISSNIAIAKAVEKYGLDSKQVKALIKLYEE